MLKGIAFAIKAELQKHGMGKVICFSSPAQCKKAPHWPHHNGVGSVPSVSPHHVLNEGG